MAFVLRDAGQSGKQLLVVSISSFDLGCVKTRIASPSDSLLLSCRKPLGSQNIYCATYQEWLY
jgi:hypothetical protein